jgi:hypothetical protein
MSKKRGRRGPRKRQTPQRRGAPHNRERPTIVQAMAENTRSAKQRMSERGDRFTELLAKTVEVAEEETYLAQRSGLTSAEHAELSPGSSDSDSPRAWALRGLAPALDRTLAAKALDAVSECRRPAPRTCAAVLLAASLDDPELRTVALWDALTVLDDPPADIVSDPPSRHRGPMPSPLSPPRSTWRERSVS